MLSHINHMLPKRLLSRALSQAVNPGPSVHPDHPLLVRYPYFVRRNSRGNLPVYSNIRYRVQYFLKVKDVEGDVNALAQELQETLLPPGSEQAKYLKVRVEKHRDVVLRGGRCKRELIEWLNAKGF